TADPAPLGFPVSTWSFLVLLPLLGRELPPRRQRLLGWLLACLLPSGEVAHEAANGPGERHLVTLDRVVVGGALPLLLAAGEVVAFAVRAVEQLPDHGREDPLLGVGTSQISGLQFIHNPRVCGRGS